MLNAAQTYKIAFAILLWRSCLSILIRTSFDPDEYWQGPEVAHRLVFGYGHLTWEWAAGLRSYAHPLLFAPGLLVLQLLRLDSPAAVQLAPRVTQALLSLLHDAVLMAFARSHLPAGLHIPALLISSLSWFNCFTHTRPFSNCIESTLHLAALAVWPRTDTPSAVNSSRPAALQTSRRAQRALAILLAGLCCVIRPPAAVLFLPIAAWELWHSPLTPSGPNRSSLARLGHAAVYLFDCLILAAAIVAVNGLLDRHFYGRWVFPAWVNLEFNVLQNSSADYGTHPAHWYFSQGLPAMLGSLLPLTAWGVWAAIRQRHAGTSRPSMPLWPLFLAAWGIALHSFLPHKEFRYILPSFELVLLYAAVPLAHLPSTLHQDNAKRIEVPPLRDASSSVVSGPVDGLRKRVAGAARSEGLPSEPHSSDAVPAVASDAWWGQVVCAAAIGLQLPMLAYFGLVHQRGTVAVIEHLSRARIPSGSAVLFLTNCHATPWQAHMHRKDIMMTFLDCSPPEWFEATRAQNVLGSIGTMAEISIAYRDEQRAFEADPVQALCSVYGCREDESKCTDACNLETGSDSDSCASEWSMGIEGHGHRDMPLYIVLFQDMARDVSAFLTSHGYTIEQSFLQNPFDDQFVELYRLGGDDVSLEVT